MLTQKCWFSFFLILTVWDFRMAHRNSSQIGRWDLKEFSGRINRIWGVIFVSPVTIKGYNEFRDSTPACWSHQWLNEFLLTQLTFNKITDFILLDIIGGIVFFSYNLFYWSVILGKGWTIEKWSVCFYEETWVLIRTGKNLQ